MDDLQQLVSDELTRSYGAIFDHRVWCGETSYEWDLCRRWAEHLKAGEDMISELARVKAEGDA